MIGNRHTTIVVVGLFERCYLTVVNLDIINLPFVFLSFSRTSEETRSMGLPEDNFTTINPLCKTNDTDHTDAGVVYTFFSVVSLISSVSGLPLNVYVVWLILRGAGSGIGPEFFTLNLALSDILFFTGYLMMPFFSFFPHCLAT